METKRQTTDASVYEIEKHRHNFGLWTAARAVQRGFMGAKFAKIKEAIERTGIESYGTDEGQLPTTEAAFDEIHRKWCHAICDSIARDTSYGRAAKIVAIYLKTTVVIPHQVNAAFIKVIHPPIDRILLTAIGKAHPELNECLGIPWTRLNESQYFGLIDKLRRFNGDQPFWKLEAFWRPSGNASREE